MRIATVEHQGRAAAAVITPEDSVRLLPEEISVLALVQGGLPALLSAGAAASGTELGLHEVRLLPPLQPPSIRDFVAFEEHVAGVIKSVTSAATVPDEWYEAPTFYFSNPHTLIGAHDDVPIPPGSAVLDFELEVAAVLGRGGRDLTGAAAHDAIAAYTILNDWSARDLQRREMRVGLGPAKGKDFASTLGPWLVTADEFRDRHHDGFLQLEMTVAVNGERIGSDVLSNMGWPFAELVAYASCGSRVQVGDVLGSGTCGNGGCLAELWGRTGAQSPPPLQPGDVVSMTVEGIGTIRNTVIPPHPAPPPPPRARPAPGRRSAPSSP